MNDHVEVRGANVAPRVRADGSLRQVRAALSQSPFRWAAYEDVRNGRGTAPGFDEWRQLDQLAYEEGRTVAAELSRYDANLPAWERLHDPPPRLVELILRWQADHPGEAALPPEFGVAIDG